MTTRAYGLSQGNVADIAGARWKGQQAALAKDAYGEKKRQQNTLWLAGAAKHALDNNMDPTVVSTLFEEGKRRGLLDPSADPSQASKQGMMKIYQGAVTSLGGESALQSQVTDNRTAPMKNYEQRQKLVDQYGPDSPQVRTFDNYVRKIPGLTVLEVQRSDGSTQQILYDPASANQWDLSGRQIAQGPSNYTAPGQQIEPQQPPQQPPMQQPPMGAAPPTAGAAPPTAGAVPPQGQMPPQAPPGRSPIQPPQPPPQYGVSMTPEAEAAAKQRGQQGGLDLTPGERKVDEAFADDYAEWVGAGGYADVAKNVAQLTDAQQALLAAEKGGKPSLTGSTAQKMLPRWGWSRIEDEAALDTLEKVEEVVQRNLRLILGAQFTEKEGTRLIERAYNPFFSEQRNAERITRLLRSLLLAAQAKEQAAQYYRQYGTLKGYEGLNNLKGSIEFMRPEDSEQRGEVTVEWVK